jgi:chromosome segregation ATPase
MADLLQRAVRGELGELGGTVDVHGVERQLTDALVAQLGLPADVDVLVRPVDLPGARSVVPEHAATDAVVDEQDDLPDLRALANELSQARHALARATENRAHTEDLLDGSRHALAPEAADVADAEARLADARRRRDDAAARLEAAITSTPNDDRHRVATDRARLQEERATLEGRRQQIMEAIDRLVADGVDPSAIAAALTALKRWRPTEPRPVQEALDLADQLDDVHAELAALPEPPAPPPSMLADAERELADARNQVSTAEAALAERRVSPEDAARIDELHAEVVDAEDRAERRLASPLTKKRVKDALAAENEFLGERGFSSYSDYLLSTSTLIVDPAAPKRVADARRRLADAEAVWDELTGHGLRAQREALEEREVALLKHARELLGTLPDGTSTDVSAALRDLRAGNDAPDDRQLVAALFNAGIDIVDDDPIATAERFLAVADERHVQRAALQAELATVVDDLDGVTTGLASLPPTADDTTDELDDARTALRVAQEDEQRAHRAVVDARARAAEHRAAIQRIEALEADLAGARAAEQQATAHVARLEQTTADAERVHEQRRRERQARAEALDAVLDLADVERVPTEVYLLARVAAQREVGEAGSLPLIVADATTGLSVETTQGVLDVIERFSPVVQFVLMSDDPDIEEWARSFGAEGAAVRRFSFVPANAQ